MGRKRASASVLHLDTNVLIGALVPGSAAAQSLQRWLLAGETLAVSAIAWSEFLCGGSDQSVSHATRAAALQLIGDPAPFDVTAAELAAELFNATGRRRGSLGDCMVAASAMTQHACLATASVTDFAMMREAGLDLRAVKMARNVADPYSSAHDHTSGS